MKKIFVFIILVLIFLKVDAQSLSTTQMQNARASGYAAIAARNPGVSFSVLMIPWDGINTLEYNAQKQINSGWHAQAAIKGNYFYQAFDGFDFSQYSTVLLSQEEFDTYKNTGTQWWIACSTLPPFSNTGFKINTNGSASIIATDNSGNRTNPFNALTITTDNPNYPYDNFGGSILFKNRSYANGLVNSSRIRSVIYDNGNNLGGGLWFETSQTAGSNLTPSMVISNSGNVGVGSISPFSKLDVKFQAPFNTSIPGVNPYGLFLSGQSTADYATGITFSAADASPGTAQSGIYSQGSGSYGTRLYFATTDNYAAGAKTRMIIDAVGNVGIGTNAPGSYKLAVEGTIGARKIKVTQQGIPWADYVFHDSYQLRSLDALDKFIQQYKHLPEVPTTQEVNEYGLDLADTQALLLKKIEELTLYMIELKKENEQLIKRVMKLEKNSTKN